MIPKTIHYCWFGGAPLPELAQKCIASWERFFPDYTIQRWDETNYDVNAVPYIQEAYQAKRWAFVSDYARFDILHKHGGLYFDTDVEMIAPMQDVLDAGAFMGLQRTVLPSGGEKVYWPAPGLGLAAEPGMEIYREILQQYKDMHFLMEDGSLNLNTVPMYTFQILQQHGFDQCRNELQKAADVVIYPTDYFSPIDYFTGEKKITPNTRAIHHFSASWLTPEEKKVARLDHLARGKGKILGGCIYCGTLPLRLYYRLKSQGVGAVVKKIKSKLGCRG